MLKRIITYTLLTGLILFSIFIIISTYLCKDPNTSIDWNTITSSISVIATCLIALTTFNLIILQENEYTPCVILRINTKRIEIYQLELINSGKVTAYNIKFKWNNELLNIDEESVFNETKIIESLLPKESIIKYLGTTHDLQSNRRDTYECQIRYMDKNGKKYNEQFSLNLSNLDQTLTITSERMKAYKSIQGIERILKSK